MHGELAQLVALAAHGSAYLAGPVGLDQPELFPTSSVFRFTNRVEFRRERRILCVLPKTIIVGRGCAPWYSDLRQRGAVALRLARGDTVPRNRELARYVEAGFSGGLDIGVVAHFVDGTRELWTGQWMVTMPQHPEQRIWSVRFRGAGAASRSKLDEGPAVATALGQLGDALEAAAAYAGGPPFLESWQRVFRAAYALLDADNPQVPYHTDLLPPNHYAIQARRLLAAASGAWVFGGMGSWNDVAVEDVERYRLVTARLFDAVLDAVLAGANSIEAAARGAVI